MIPKIVVLDGYTLNPGDLTWDALSAIGSLTVYDRTPAELVVERAREATIILVNKQIMDAAMLAALPQLRFIGVTATGYNNVDVSAARQRDIAVANVAGYSTLAVAQHVFALLLEMTNKVAAHHASVQQGDWSRQADFSYTLGPIVELSSLRLGIYGFGRIGQAVARVALALGMQVSAHHKHPQRDALEGVDFVDLPTLFSTCQVVTLHAPLNTANDQIVNRALLATMPNPGFLINTGRGGLVNEADLRYCLEQGLLAGAALDVLRAEPPPPDHPLLSAPNCILTPHMAWASVSARQRLLAESALNVKAFLAGEQRNWVS
ncbi:MAG: glycerate dehydrogenase [Bacteroidetes bacterium]|nr:MAG: glycerate dehydrogenase [Bacteroidota bacterium]PTM13855.1 MAG: glycerate dehydrogenase [Bacteroidota bacterium]